MLSPMTGDSRLLRTLRSGATRARVSGDPIGGTQEIKSGGLRLDF